MIPPKTKEDRRLLNQCVHCQRTLEEGYTYESCPSCKKIIKLANGSWRWQQTIDVLDHYGWRCACCGETEPMFLTIDHKEGKGNIHRAELKGKIKDWYQWIIKENFPEEFQTLCYNCNLGKSRNGGTCPHANK
jgi:hypothetical protein